MAYLITEECISCAACIYDCPNDAIFQDDELQYEINPELCTECVENLEGPHCLRVCPIEDAIIQNQNYLVAIS